MKEIDGITFIEAKSPDVVGEFGSVRVGDEQYILKDEPTIEKCADGTFKIGNFEKVPELYLCDPEKNISCKKTSCQTLCKYTTNKDYKKE